MMRKGRGEGLFILIMIIGVFGFLTAWTVMNPSNTVKIEMNVYDQKYQPIDNSVVKVVDPRSGFFDQYQGCKGRTLDEAYVKDGEVTFEFTRSKPGNNNHNFIFCSPLERMDNDDPWIASASINERHLQNEDTWQDFPTENYIFEITNVTVTS